MYRWLIVLGLCAVCVLTARAQYPDEIRGYKVARAKVEIKGGNDAAHSPEADAFAQLSTPRLLRVTPLGATFEVDLTIQPVKQGGQVHFLTFENVRINDTVVEIEDYTYPFTLPNDKPLRLKHPVHVFVSTANALNGVLDNFRNARETWQVSGRVYIFGRFKKFLFKFKRVIPVEFALTVPNPLLDEPHDQATKPTLHHAFTSAPSLQTEAADVVRARSANALTIADIEARYYFAPIKAQYEKRVADFGAAGALNHLSEVMRDATPEVEKTIQTRVAQGVIKDADQARKSVAGNGFQALTGYTLIRLQQNGGLPAHLIITLKPRQHPDIERYATIQVGDEIQKPDIDLLVFSATDTRRRPIVIYSVKTSLRERAGQTYRWKLLLDVATGGCANLSERYNLRYDNTVTLKLGFITADFYEEIDQPQALGALKFFDFAYLTKPKGNAAARGFSGVVADLKKLYP